ncbi:2-amino-4-hydroxy-6-hydroxymethyldihydropteridine diphosphokinase [Swingsia samuiensis]|uniref:Bifunctional folate synthesis protein n=1 Tax=Swingsia samuiensis TaxID=1293412 RepID=A0A4Y6UJB7_9PROT|nr:2-amino-4-hydroxy-6-hydroxymethyldihydropteridine diphosphokinase [Swingsia samuiensis]QDH16566.1 2-amino-4-hydroxy-6-hydroxymethyldihydropteridine diphosphokinase [Swingsia samuiensis]
MISSPLTSVYVKDLTLYGFHGVLAEEKKLGQRFIVDMHIQADLTSAAQQDDYHQAVCYSSLCDVAAEIIKGKSLDLIETVAEHVANAVLERFSRVEYVEITVRKPSAPVPYSIKEAAVCVKKQRLHSIGLSLGANLGEREFTLSAAIERLSLYEGIEVLKTSSLYDSAPWGGVEQPAFINMCVTGKTSLSPHQLLRACKDIERDLGRQPSIRWGARAIDIDVLYYGERSVSDRILVLPHRHLFERAFVLEPLAEIAPDQRVAGRRIADALTTLPRSNGDVTRRD